MFVPGFYREPESSWAADLVRQNPLAVLVSDGAPNGVPFATHLPIILDPQTTDESTDNLVGTTLLGHLNRANPHWAALADGMRVLAIFTGAHAYVSPTVYGTTPAAPTWNFTAVHVQGVLRTLDAEGAAEETLDVVRATVRTFEGRFGADWDMTGSQEYFRRIVPAVGAFRLDVVDVQGMFKLSQDQTPEMSARVQRWFSRSPSCRHQDVAELMGRLPQCADANASPSSVQATGNAV